MTEKYAKLKLSGFNLTNNINIELKINFKCEEQSQSKLQIYNYIVYKNVKKEIKNIFLYYEAKFNTLFFNIVTNTIKIFVVS